MSRPALSKACGVVSAQCTCCCLSPRSCRCDPYLQEAPSTSRLQAAAAAATAGVAPGVATTPSVATVLLCAGKGASSTCVSAREKSLQQTRAATAAAARGGLGAATPGSSARGKPEWGVLPAAAQPPPPEDPRGPRLRCPAGRQPHLRRLLEKQRVQNRLRLQRRLSSTLPLAVVRRIQRHRDLASVSTHPTRTRK